jgi:hypothetical protein
MDVWLGYKHGNVTKEQGKSIYCLGSIKEVEYKETQNRVE